MRLTFVKMISTSQHLSTSISTDKLPNIFSLLNVWILKKFDAINFETLKLVA